MIHGDARNDLLLSHIMNCMGAGNRPLALPKTVRFLVYLNPLLNPFVVLKELTEKGKRRKPLKQADFKKYNHTKRAVYHIFPDYIFADNSLFQLAIACYKKSSVHKGLRIYDAIA